MRLIYAGRLLRDEQVLGTTLSGDGDAPRVVHLALSDKYSDSSLHRSISRWVICLLALLLSPSLRFFCFFFFFFFY